MLQLRGLGGSRKQEVGQLLRRSQVGGLAQGTRRLRQGGKQQAVPVGEHLFVAAGSGTCPARRCQLRSRLAQASGELRRLEAELLSELRRWAGLVQDVAALEIAIVCDAERRQGEVGEARRLEELSHFGCGPNVEAAFLTL